MVIVSNENGDCLHYETYLDDDGNKRCKQCDEVLLELDDDSLDDDNYLNPAM